MEREKTEFNMAVSYLDRLNALFYAADEAAMALDANGWYHVLLNLRRELSTEMKAGELDKFNADAREIRELLGKNNRGVSRFGLIEIKQELYDKLDAFEIALRKIMKEAGLQMKMQDDASHSLR